METRRNQKKNNASDVEIIGERLIKLEESNVVLEDAQIVVEDEITANVSGSDNGNNQLYQDDVYYQDEAANAAGAVASDDLAATSHENVEIVKIVPLPHARSEVWTYFGFVANNSGDIVDKSKVVCKICASRFCYSGNTTNFYSHLKSMHSEVQIGPKALTPKGKRPFSLKEELEEDEGEDSFEFASSEPGSSIKTSNKRFRTSQETEERDVLFVDDITQAIVDFIITDCRPTCVVHGKGFQRLLNLLVPEYKIPDRQQLKMTIRKRFDEFAKKDCNDLERFF